MGIKPVGTTETVYRNSLGELKNAKTLKVSGKIDETSDGLIVFGDKRYSKTEIKSEKTGKTEYLYISMDDDVTEVTKPEEYASTSATNDGIDDGHITGGEICKSIFKGIWKPIKSMFTDEKGEFSPLKTVGSAVIAGAAIGLCCIPVAGPFISAGLIAFGLGSGAWTLGKGAIKAYTAKTDAEARDAWGDIGNGSFTVATSLIGMKSLNNAAKSAKAAQATQETTTAVPQVANGTSAGDKVVTVGGSKVLDMLSTLRNGGNSVLTTFVKGGKFILSLFTDPITPLQTTITAIKSTPLYKSADTLSSIQRTAYGAGNNTNIFRATCEAIKNKFFNISDKTSYQINNNNLRTTNNYLETCVNNNDFVNAKRTFKIISDLKPHLNDEQLKIFENSESLYNGLCSKLSIGKTSAFVTTIGDGAKLVRMCQASEVDERNKLKDVVGIV